MALNSTSSCLNIFIFIVLAINGVLGAGSLSPEIIEAIRPVVRKKGDTGRLKCTVSLKEASNMVAWYQRRMNNFDIAISQDDKIVAPNDVVKSGEASVYKYAIDVTNRPDGSMTYTLIVRKLEEVDGGIYKCVIETNGMNRRDYPMKTGRMDVQVSPQIMVSGTTNTAEPVKGQRFVFTCVATGVPKPTLKWVRADGQTLPDGQQSREGGVYIIENVQPYHRGVYRCVASNNVKPPDEHDAILNIMYKPNVKAVQDSYGQAENRQYKVSLECEVSGSPEPTVEWWRVVPSANRRTKLIRNEKYDIKQSRWQVDTGSDEVKLNTLTISNVRSNDYTHYYCTASNSEGDAEAKIKLFETTECQGTLCGDSDGPGSSSTTVTASTVCLLLVAMFYFI